MRQIKLRAHVGGHGMTKPFMIGDLCKHVPILTSDGIVDIRNNFNDTLMTLMRFTGIKDKKKVEIYEDDICKIKNEWSKTKYIGKVKFGFHNLYCESGYRACWALGFYIEGKDESIFIEPAAELNMSDQIEVIGNIYEDDKWLGRD